MRSNHELMQDLAAAKGLLDRIAIDIHERIVAEDLGVMVYPTWDCGHQHATREQAIRCRQGATHLVKLVAEGKSDNLRVPAEKEPA